jgi:hypothetical protein
MCSRLLKDYPIINIVIIIIIDIIIIHLAIGYFNSQILTVYTNDVPYISCSRILVT